MKRRFIIPIVFIYLLECAVGSISGITANQSSSWHAKTTVLPVVEIEAGSKVGQNQPLAFRCKISNSERERLYIYSTLLQNPQFAEMVVDSRQKLIELRFSRLQTSPLLPYYFPQAAFTEIPANNSAEFFVKSNVAVKELRGYEIINGATREARITPGRWSLRIMIGYGDDVSAVKAALASDTAGQEHPINEIVKWQKVAFSNSIAIDVTK